MNKIIILIFVLFVSGCMCHGHYDYYNSISFEEFCRTRNGQPFKVYDETQSGQWITCYNYKQDPPYSR